MTEWKDEVELQMDTMLKIKEFKPQHNYFIGIDSDGTAFDTMEIKHRRVLFPIAIDIWGLQEVEEEFVQIGGFINLYSSFRGINRFPALALTFDYLKEQLADNEKAKILPEHHELKEFVDSGFVMSNDSLKEYIKGKNSFFLEQVLRWSEDSNQLLAKITYEEGNPPYTYVKESLEKVKNIADTMVISSASSAAIHQDWSEGGILEHITLIAGQEAGDKSKQLEYAVKGKYDVENCLMVGDALGDLKAAKGNGILFYPILPGREVESWERFYKESCDVFFENKYSGEYESRLIQKFIECLPEPSQMIK